MSKPPRKPTATALVPFAGGLGLALLNFISIDGEREVLISIGWAAWSVLFLTLWAWNYRKFKRHQPEQQT